MDMSIYYHQATVLLGPSRSALTTKDWGLSPVFMNSAEKSKRKVVDDALEACQIMEYLNVPYVYETAGGYHVVFDAMLNMKEIKTTYEKFLFGFAHGLFGSFDPIYIATCIRDTCAFIRVGLKPDRASRDIFMVYPGEDLTALSPVIRRHAECLKIYDNRLSVIGPEEVYYE
ncbi:MAG: hypothetical protein GY861_20945 [bacterium]|nr:hypothetical protein [bacterium]